MTEVGHLNIIGFKAAVAALKDDALAEQPFVIAGKIGGQVAAWDVSPAALREGITPGTPLAAAQRLVKDLKVVESDPRACLEANNEIEKVISRYAPVWQNDGAGNIYFDITGTRRIFGPAADCVCRIQNEIQGCLKIESAAAAGTNKLVCKVASRTIRPEGLIDVRPGDEEAFLRHQDIALLPGIGPSLMKTIRVTGFRETGELACLSDSEALSLFGKKGLLLRDSARGIDDSPVSSAKNRGIESRADFPEDVLDETVIRGTIASLAEHAGLQMRKDKLGAGAIRFCVLYADGMQALAGEKKKRLLVLDKDITAAASSLFEKHVTRRIRVRSICLSLEDLCPLMLEPDLFEPETETKGRMLQEAVDKIQNRYGTGKITRGIVLAAGAVEQPLLTQ
ncbi:MAG: DNA polymerase [Treponema sp.]|nr:DNA polymerase [Treponema sp.]